MPWACVGDLLIAIWKTRFQGQEIWLEGRNEFRLSLVYTYVQQLHVARIRYSHASGDGSMDDSNNFCSFKLAPTKEVIFYLMLIFNRFPHA